MWDWSLRFGEACNTPVEVQKALFRVENSMHELLVIVKVNNSLLIVEGTSLLV